MVSVVGMLVAAASDNRVRDDVCVLCDAVTEWFDAECDEFAEEQEGCCSDIVRCFLLSREVRITRGTFLKNRTE